MSAYAYLLRCSDGTLYAGACRNIAERLASHATGRGAKYTRARLPVALVYSEACATWAAACRREAQLKRLSRRQKEMLCAERHV